MFLNELINISNKITFFKSSLFQLDTILNNFKAINGLKITGYTGEIIEVKISGEELIVLTVVKIT